MHHEPPQNDTTATTDEKARSRWAGSSVAVLEGLLWTVSAVLLTSALWIFGEGYFYQLRAQELVIPVATSPAVAADSAVPDRSAAESHRPHIEPGSPIARLEIPRLDVSVVIAEGVSSKALRKAVGHVPASARPGETGNIALAGHRDTFFRPLKDIQVGDRILLESNAGSHGYRVEWTDVVEPSDVSVVGPSEDEVLTLVTCYPFNWVGHAPQRFIVRARREG